MNHASIHRPHVDFQEDQGDPASGQRYEELPEGRDGRTSDLHRTEGVDRLDENRGHETGRGPSSDRV